MSRSAPTSRRGSDGPCCPACFATCRRVDTRTTVLGTEVPAPILVAPTAMHRFFCDEGELRPRGPRPNVARCSSCRWRRRRRSRTSAAAAPSGPHWAQMYMLRDRGRTRALCERDAKPATRRSSRRSTGRQWAAAAPEAGAGALSPPEWLRYPNLASPDDPDTADIMALVGDFDPSVTFDDLALFREWSGLPVVVKGVLRATTPAACIDSGCGIAVSNHGGRIFDGIVATADMLPRRGRRGRRPRRGVRRRWRPQRHRCREGHRARRTRGARRPPRALGPHGRRRARSRGRARATLRPELEAAMAFCGAPACRAHPRSGRPVAPLSGRPLSCDWGCCKHVAHGATRGASSRSGLPTWPGHTPSTRRWAGRRGRNPTRTSSSSRPAGLSSACGTAPGSPSTAAWRTPWVSAASCLPTTSPRRMKSTP